MNFTGFTPETIDFLWGLRMNNRRDWFLEHKDQYTRTLYEPMKALGRDLFGIFEGRPGVVCKVSRIYRDARLHHPLPYKEGLWICLRPDTQWWGDNPCLFFEIKPEGVNYGFFFWQPPTAQIERFRQEIDANPREFLEILEKAQEKTGIPVTAECYKRPKTPEHLEVAAYFAWRRCIECIRQEPVEEAMFGPDLGRRAAQFLADCIPLYDFFTKFGGA